MSAGNAIRAGAAFVEATLRDKVSGRLKKLQKRLKAWGSSVTSMGKGLLSASAVVLGPLAASVKLFTSFGDEIGKAARRTGVSVEAMSELKVAAERSGASFQNLEGGLRKMSQFMLNAERGSTAMTDTLDDLGLSLDDLKNLSPEEQFKTFAEAISRIDDPSRRAALAMQVFGKSGTMLLPMFANGAKGIEELQQAARDLGLTLSTEEAEAAEALTDKLADLWDVIKIGMVRIGAAVAGPITDFANWVIRIAQYAGKWVQENQTLIATVGKIAAIVAVVGTALVGLGALLTAASTAFGVLASLATFAGTAISIVGGVIGFLFSPLGLVIGGLALLATWFFTSTDAGRQFASYLLKVFGEIGEIAGETFTGIKDALTAGDFELAARILWSGLRVAWATGVNALQKIWLEFKVWFLNLFDQMTIEALRKSSSMFSTFSAFLRKLPGGEKLATQTSILSTGLDFAAFGLERTAQQRKDTRTEEKDAALAEAEAALAKAHKELLDATGEAKKKREELAGPAFTRRTDGVGFDPSELLDGVPDVVAKATVQGTFSAAAASRFAAGSDDAEEKQAANTLELVKIGRQVLTRLIDFFFVDE